MHVARCSPQMASGSVRSPCVPLGTEKISEGEVITIPMCSELGQGFACMQRGVHHSWLVAECQET